MSALQTIPSELKVVVMLAHLLERLERSGVPVSPEQYRSVVSRLSEELSRHRCDAALQAVLDAHPATAELYENLHYRHAGLCQSPLDDSLHAELRARKLIARLQEKAGGPGERPRTSSGRS